MRVGLVSPYSLDVPGGVQQHVLELAGQLRGRGHQVSVLAPADEEAELPEGVVSGGRAVPVPYNGSVARLCFGPVASQRTTAWLSEGRFDVVHVHEPAVPSLSLLAVLGAEVPVVATFHNAMERSRALRVARSLYGPAFDRIYGRIAVSEEARRTMREHWGGEAVVVPNGIDAARLGEGRSRPEFAGSAVAPTVLFLGRFTEARKGLDVVLAAWPQIRRHYPGARLLIAGPGEPGPWADQPGVEVLGQVSDVVKADLWASVSAYVAPNTGGESFGIIVAEAMAAGAPVVASDLLAFRAVLGEPPAGVTFPVGEAAGLSCAVLSVLDDPDLRARLVEHGRRRARAFDWGHIVDQVEAVYTAVVELPLSPPVPMGWIQRLKWKRGRDA